MKCFNPVLCFTLDKKRIFRNWDVAKNTTYLRGIKPTYLYDCGKCGYCKHKKAIELAARCSLHASVYTQNMFLTLTYDEKKEGYQNVLRYRDIQLFKKSLRATVWRNHGRRIDVFNVHEYGKNAKKHWHAIVFNYNPEDREFHTLSDAGHALYRSEILRGLWPHGFHSIGDVNEATAMYQAQYMEKDLRNGHSPTSIHRSVSRHSGLGKPYFLKHYRQILMNGFVPFGGKKLGIPRYFQKLAHKHWCHFNQKSAFFDTPERKQLYRPFKLGEENEDISQLFESYRNLKEERIMELELEFEETIRSYLSSKLVTQFEQSGSNYNYDLKHKIKQERF